ncbi:MAG TPA: glycerol-3-phosphate 1-O-acyltransferase PlsY [Longimicrobiales bacterium]|nr:glycerol-3-phosphate 1-O-acyltransferase PlsY [Longimicrobiales bacterium]
MLIIAAYFTGAIPTSYIVGRLRGIDLRREGSGNLGATNAFRVLGWRAATPVVIVDIAKGWFPTFFFPLWDRSDVALLALAYGAAAIVGHVFSIYVRFKGGKGVATSAGVLLAVAPLAVLIAFIIWAALVFTTGYVSLGSVVAAAILPVVIYLQSGITPILWLAVFLSVFVILKHKANMVRLMRGEEHSFKKKKASMADKS